MLPTVAIVGRPNVGKSTLFNRLVGRRLALVDDRPGVTRDRREGDGRIADIRFRVVDTAGYEDERGDELPARMREQTERAVETADVVLFVMDAREGVTPSDEVFAAWLRRHGRKPIILVANKSEGRSGPTAALDAYSLGLGVPLPLSAEHGEGIGELYDALAPFCPRDEEEAAQTEKPLALAIIGRPNVGKSTLVNRLLGEERMLTGPEAGITRDSIASLWSWEGRPVRLFDTAGLRRRARVDDKLERLSVADTLRAIRFAEVVVLALDAEQLLEKQDLTIASLVADEGRAAVIAVNKWDLVTDRQATLKRLGDRLETSLKQLDGIATVPVSARTGAGIDKLMAAVFETHEIWNRRVSTSRLNRWLEDMIERHPPPLVEGRRLKLRYITQANTRPPTFALFASRPGALPEAYRRYLTHGLRESFGLSGVPIRVMLRGSGKNPFVGSDE